MISSAKTMTAIDRKTKCDKEQKYFKCRFCEYGCLRRYNVARHEIRIHLQKINKDCCGKLFSTKADYYHHCKEYHRPSRSKRFISKIKYGIYHQDDVEHIIDNAPLSYFKKNRNLYAKLRPKETNKMDKEKVEQVKSEVNKVIEPETVDVIVKNDAKDDLKIDYKPVMEVNEDEKENVVLMEKKKKIEIDKKYLPLKKRILVDIQRENIFINSHCINPISVNVKLIVINENQKDFNDGIKINHKMFDETAWRKLSADHLSFLADIDFDQLKK